MNDLEKRLREWGSFRATLDELLMTAPDCVISDSVKVMNGTEVHLTIPERIVGRVTSHHESNPSAARIDLLVRRMQPSWAQVLHYRYVTHTPGKVLSEPAVAALAGIGRRKAAERINRALGWIEANW